MFHIFSKIKRKTQKNQEKTTISPIVQNCIDVVKRANVEIERYGSRNNYSYKVRYRGRSVFYIERGSFGVYNIELYDDLQQKFSSDKKYSVSFDGLKELYKIVGEQYEILHEKHIPDQYKSFMEYTDSIIRSGTQR